MIIIGEKLNGAIPAVKTAIADRDAEPIRSRPRIRPEHILSTALRARCRNWNMRQWYG